MASLVLINSTILHFYLFIINCNVHHQHMFAFVNVTDTQSFFYWDDTFQNNFGWCFFQGSCALGKRTLAPKAKQEIRNYVVDGNSRIWWGTACLRPSSRNYVSLSLINYVSLSFIWREWNSWVIDLTQSYVAAAFKISWLLTSLILTKCWLQLFAAHLKKLTLNFHIGKEVNNMHASHHEETSNIEVF